MAGQEERIRRLLDCIETARQEACDCIDCETCNQGISCLAEMAATGVIIPEMLPDVQEHILSCTDCREEFEALICILRAESSGALAEIANSAPNAKDTSS
jgi:hypothetical protein